MTTTASKRKGGVGHKPAPTHPWAKWQPGSLSRDPVVTHKPPNKSVRRGGRIR